MNRVTIAGCLAAALLVSLSAGAQQYPTKPVTVVAPFPPGGSTDILARMDAARAVPDGHTITLVSVGFTFLSSLQQTPMYDPVKDFAPISLMSLSPNLLVVHPSSPIRSMADFIAYARAHPTEVNYGTSGVGSFAHLAGEWLASITGTKMTFVPYKGLGDALLAVASGQIHVTATAVTSSMPFVKSGRLRAIAVTTSERLKVLPDLPSTAETVKGYSWAQWNGYLAPARTPREIVERLSAEMVKIAKSPDNVQKLAADGAIPVGNSPQEFAKIINSEAAQWRKLIASMGLKLSE